MTTDRHEAEREPALRSDRRRAAQAGAASGTRSAGRVLGAASMVLALAAVLGWAVLPPLDAQGALVGYERLLSATKDSQNWLTYNGSYMSQRHSALAQITPANVKTLEQKWVVQNRVSGAWQATPLVVDGVMYVTQRPNDIVALDAETGRVFWIYRHNTSPDQKACCGSNNRGVAILGDALFMGTLDGMLVSVDASTGKLNWKVKVAEMKAAYSLTLAPLAVKDKIIVGVGGGEYGIRGFVAAYEARTGKQVWKFNTIPSPGEPGSETWQNDAWVTGGGPVWVTGSFDPALNLTYWGVGNPGPDWNSDQRPGDNLYTDCVIALDADTGRLKWHFQFTPNDTYDYDSVQVPVLVDAPWNGVPAKLMLWANRNGYFYVLDRETGRFLLGKPFVKVNWSSGLDERGRPIPTPQPVGAPTWPGNQGATNWYSPSYSPRTGLFYLSAWDDYATIYRKEQAKYVEGRYFTGGGFRVYGPTPNATPMPTLNRGPINDWTDAVGKGTVMAIDPATGQRKWRFDMADVTDSGVLTTDSDLLFTGGREGYFQALDARTGALLWKTNLGGQIVNGPITYGVKGKQYVATIAGNILVSFGLRDP